MRFAASVAAIGDEEHTMTSSQHQYNIGDAVLVNFDGAQVPGVIQDEGEGRFQIRLAEPWANETGQKSDTIWCTPDRLEAYIEEETGGEQALPAPE
jgi:hypothetical protein